MKYITIGIVTFFMLGALISTIKNKKAYDSKIKCLEYTGYYEFEDWMPHSYKVFCHE